MNGLYFEEIVVGAAETLGSFTFTREAIVAFAERYDPQPFHVDEAAARQTHFGRLAASGWHTSAVWMKCFVAANLRQREARLARGEAAPEIGPSPGFENLKWSRPVHAGDTITYASTITGKRRLNSRPGWGLVFSANTGTNQDGVTVFSFDGKVLVRCRD
jgi:acyl dehydratase